MPTEVIGVIRVLEEVAAPLSWSLRVRNFPLGFSGSSGSHGAACDENLRLSEITFSLLSCLDNAIGHVLVATRVSMQ